MVKKLTDLSLIIEKQYQELILLDENLPHANYIYIYIFAVLEEVVLEIEANFASLSIKTALLIS